MTDDEPISNSTGGADSDARTVPSPRTQPIRWYRTSTNSLVVAFRDAVSVLLAILVVGVVLVAISGLLTPIAIVQSNSMAPTLQEGDLVFLVEPDRYPGAGADERGVVTRAAGERTDYGRFGQPGDVIVYSPNGRSDTTPIIHRAEFRVQAGERWSSRATPGWLGDAERCAELSGNLCPAPHDGYITKGDANAQYDQTVDGGASSTTTVRSEWIRGKALVRLRSGHCVEAVAGIDACLIRIAR